jgi:probable rRNA maturation factor
MIKNLQVISGDKRIDKILLHRLVGGLKNDFGFKIVNLEIIFVDEMEIKRINKKYLKHNYSTDIITFNYSGTEKMIDSEFYISLDDAASNSSKFKVSLSEEIIRLVIHGVLHLMGYSDHTKGTKKVMKKLENQLFNKYRTALLQPGR